MKIRNAPAVMLARNYGTASFCRFRPDPDSDPATDSGRRSELARQSRLSIGVDARRSTRSGGAGRSSRRCCASRRRQHQSRPRNRPPPRPRKEAITHLKPFRFPQTNPLRRRRPTTTRLQSSTTPNRRRNRLPSPRKKRMIPTPLAPAMWIRASTSTRSKRKSPWASNWPRKSSVKPRSWTTRSSPST